MGKRSVLEMQWWGKIVVGLFVAGLSVQMAGGRKRSRHVHMLPNFSVKSGERGFNSGR